MAKKEKIEGDSKSANEKIQEELKAKDLFLAGEKRVVLQAMINAIVQADLHRVVDHRKAMHTLIEFLTNNLLEK